MSMSIRPAVVGDEALLADLNRFVQDLHLAQRPDHFRPTRLEEVARWYRSLLENPTIRLWIAEEDGLPVGYLLALVHEVPENPFVRARRWCEIDQLAVDPNPGEDEVSAVRFSSTPFPQRRPRGSVAWKQHRGRSTTARTPCSDALGSSQRALGSN